MADDDDRAVLEVAGINFQDWESVFVQINRNEPWPMFRFTAAERDTMPSDWTKLQFRPGQDCNIFLGGEQAIFGVITTRQVAYDGSQHQTMLVGKGLSTFAAKSSMDSKTGENFDGMTFEQVARKVLAPFPSGVEVIGKLDATPFEKLQNQPGERVWDFLERLARPRGIVMGSDEFGNILLIGDHDKQPDSELTEGVNILKCQCIINDDPTFYLFKVRSQVAASDDNRGKAASELESLPVRGTAKYYCLNLTNSEQPVKTQAECNVRAINEMVWHEGVKINASITTRGWKMPTTRKLWKAGDVVTVNSPMAMLNGIVLAIQSVTFTQDSSSGTLTLLDLVSPIFLKIHSSFRVTLPGVLTLKDVQSAINPPTTPPPAKPDAAGGVTGGSF